MDYYPKVLVIGNFNQRTANGITIKNLFRYWPNDKVAVADYLSSKEEMISPTIKKYYKFGNEEYGFIFPLNLIKKPVKSESFEFFEPKQDTRSIKLLKKGLVFKVKLFINTIQLFLLQISGLSLVSKKYHISEDFDNWIKKFNPDIIYSTVGDISNMNLLLMIARRYQKKMVFHIFDDFINSKPQQTLFKKYWQKRMDRTFRKLLDITDLNLVISEKMATEYVKVYSKKFYPFHNPVTEKIWLTSPPKSIHNKINDTFTFAFTGAVLEHTASPLKEFITALETLKKEGVAVHLNIYTPTKLDEVIRQIGIKSQAYFKGFVPNEQIPLAIQDADASLLTLSFNKNSIRYTRLSMATKVTEYMISGKPLFVFAPAQLAVTEYVKENDAGYIVSSKSKLVEGIREFVLNDKIRQQVSKNAINLAKENHLSEKVNQRFYDLLTTL